MTVFLLVIITSIISLTLTVINFNNASQNIQMSKVALDRLNQLRSLRVILRDLFNVANGISLNNNDIIDNRFAYYTTVSL